MNTAKKHVGSVIKKKIENEIIFVYRKNIQKSDEMGINKTPKKRTG